MRQAALCFAGLIGSLFVLWAPASQAQTRAGAFTLEATVADLLPSRAATYAEIVDPAQTIRWDVYAPPSASTPPGVIVYISPRAAGLPPESWRPVLEAHNLIWISARESGNEVPRGRRVLFALLALAALEREVAYDDGRAYVAGFSGGGRTASTVAVEFPALFRGALYICGVDWRWTEDSERLARLRVNRFVFLTGHGDFNRDETRRNHGRYRSAGVEATSLMDLGYLRHALPRARDFDRAVQFLEERAPAQPNARAE
jgi:hypothetical protein